MINLPMTKDDIEKLKEINPIKYFEVLPDQLVLRLIDFASKTGFFSHFKSSIMDEMINDKNNSKIDEFVNNPINFKKAAIGGVIFLIGNTMNKYINRKGGA